MTLLKNNAFLGLHMTAQLKLSLLSLSSWGEGVRVDGKKKRKVWYTAVADELTDDSF